MKDLWIAAQEKLIDAYMDAHPGSSWNEAYMAVSGQDIDAMAAQYAADLIDQQEYAQ